MYIIEEVGVATADADDDVDTDFNQQQEDKRDDDKSEDDDDDDLSEPSIHDSVYTSQDSGIKSVVIFTLLFSVLFTRSVLVFV